MTIVNRCCKYHSICRYKVIQYLVSVYIKAGIDELDADRLPKLMANKYGTIIDGTNALGGIEQAKGTFFNFQRRLYRQAL